MHCRDLVQGQVEIIDFNVSRIQPSAQLKHAGKYVQVRASTCGVTRKQNDLLGFLRLPYECTSTVFHLCGYPMSALVLYFTCVVTL